MTNAPKLQDLRVKLFTDDWATELDEFAVTHLDENNLTVTTDQLFTGWVTVS